MKSTELRIGNILNWQVGSSIMQGVVTSLSTVSIVIDHKSTFKISSEYDTYRLIPISLTEEWLLKCKLKYSSGIWSLTDFFTICYSEINEWHNKNGYYLYANDVEYETTVCVQYVHQLQNLFYCLCGKELELIL